MSSLLHRLFKSLFPHRLVNSQPARKVSPLDLLGRPAINLDTPELQRFLGGKRIVVTGAGGSIGSEICRQIMKFCPKRLTMVDRCENALFEIDRELRERWIGSDLNACIADVCDTTRINQLFTTEQPQVVFHAAAHKHVPMMELNPGEAIKNNVFGTKAIADASQRVRADSFVLISTDKAVNPTSVMGATKRVAELYIQSLNQVQGMRVYGQIESPANENNVPALDPSHNITRHPLTQPPPQEGRGKISTKNQNSSLSLIERGINTHSASSEKDLNFSPPPAGEVADSRAGGGVDSNRIAISPTYSFSTSSSHTRFSGVRFGNVLGSSGSVIPIFQKQIEAGGPVTVTHPDMRRYFMTIPEASQLVMQSGAIGLGGEIFVLDMGQPMKIIDLAYEMIKKHGLIVGKDIEVKITGMRPGEKLFEELANDSDITRPTSHQQINIWQVPSYTPAEMRDKLDILANIIDAPRDEVVRALMQIVPEYQPTSAPAPKTKPHPTVEVAA